MKVRSFIEFLETLERIWEHSKFYTLPSKVQCESLPSSSSALNGWIDYSCNCCCCRLEIEVQQTIIILWYCKTRNIVTKRKRTNGQIYIKSTHTCTHTYIHTSIHCYNNLYVLGTLHALKFKQWATRTTTTILSIT